MDRVLKFEFGKAEVRARPGARCFGDVTIQVETREIRRNGAVRRIEPRAAAVLARLIEARGEVVTRTELLDACWPRGHGADEGLTQAVAQIRRALGDDPAAPRFVATVPKAGYRWLAEVEAPTARAPITPRVEPVRLGWRVAAAVAAVAVLGGAAGAGLALGVKRPVPRLQTLEIETVRRDAGGPPVKATRRITGSPGEVEAARAAAD